MVMTARPSGLETTGAGSKSCHGLRGGSNAWFHVYRMRLNDCGRHYLASGWWRKPDRRDVVPLKNVGVERK